VIFALTAVRSSVGSDTVTVAGELVTPLSVMRSPGTALSSTFVWEGGWATPSTEYEASSRLRSGDV
jgi:hypothetical protein